MIEVADFSGDAGEEECTFDPRERYRGSARYGNVRPIAVAEVSRSSARRIIADAALVHRERWWAPMPPPSSLLKLDLWDGPNYKQTLPIVWSEIPGRCMPS